SLLNFPLHVPGSVCRCYLYYPFFPPPLLDPYPWIHDAQNDIGQQCADDCHETVEQDQDVRHTEVTCRYGIQEQPAHARVAVDHFYKDGTAEQCHDFITEESRNRKYGISEYVLAVYGRLFHAFGPCQDDEILLFRFNDAASEILDRTHQPDQGNGETRQHQVIDLAGYEVECPRFYAGTNGAAGREQVQVIAEYPQNHQSEDELRCRKTKVCIPSDRRIEQ